MRGLKKQVEYILTEYPETRNSDKALTIKLWERFYPQRFVRRQSDGELYLNIKHIMDLPSQDGIKRHRATIQNTEGRLRADPTIEKARGVNEDLWREELGYSDTTYKRL